MGTKVQGFLKNIPKTLEILVIKSKLELNIDLCMSLFAS